MPSPFVRKNIWAHDGTFDDPTILWYARGVGALKQRPITDKTSWNYYGAIHGFNKARWVQIGYFQQNESPPPGSDKFWNQCQHGSWYFLPWHRGYVWSIETLLREAIIEAGGPVEWALPYWNYFDPNENTLPPAFGEPTMPDGSPNPLFVSQRWGSGGTVGEFMPTNLFNENALQDDDFVGDLSSFGGGETGFSHSGSFTGGIENQPHNIIHVLIGGRDPGNPNLGGLMSAPNTAGLDPTFWIHHCNIDRLWVVWRNADPNHLDPVQTTWLEGPASIGQRGFAMPMSNDVTWNFTPAETVDTEVLGYRYDDISSPTFEPQLAQRLKRLGAHVATTGSMSGGASVASKKDAELVGASTASVPIVGGDMHTSVKLDAGVRKKVQSSLSSARTIAKPDRVFLTLENVRGLADATILQVYVGLPDGANPASHPDHLAGTVGLFGVRDASEPGDGHAGNGLSFTLEITKVVDTLHLDDALDVDQLGVRIVPHDPVPTEAQISIGRISIYREGT